MNVRIPLVLLAASFASSAQTVAHWSFDQSLRPLNQSPAVEDNPSPPDRFTYSTDVPGAFVYDPLTRTSRANSGSADFKAADGLAINVDFARAQLAGASITLECFVKPDESSRVDAFLAGKTRSSDAGSELGLEWHELKQFRQTYHGAMVAAPQGRPDRFTVGHYASSSRLMKEHPGWRHLAVVYDARAGTVTAWVDYHLKRSVRTPKALSWDGGPFVIGGRAGAPRLAGKIDEVRIVRGALSPAQFLRARQDAIEGVSFVSDQKIVPRDAGCLDVKEHFGAAGDGRTDDTDAFNAAFAHLASKVPLAYNTLIIPPGTYLVSGSLYCSRFIDVKGAGPGESVIRLKDGVFTDPASPQPVLRMSSTSGDPGSHKHVNGSSISLYLEGITIDTGLNNPGAKALEYHSNNLGRLENVVLRSGDGAGVLGLDLTHHDVGPALVKRVRVDGFDVGIAIRYQEYSMTLEHVTLRNQRVAGIRNQGNILAIRGLDSQNSVPAIIAQGPNSMVTLVDSTLTGGAATQPAINSEGALYCLRVKTSGYRHAISKRTLVNLKPMEWKDSTVAGPNLDEYIGDVSVTGFGAPRGALKLPIEEAPEPQIPPVEQWVNVTRFAHSKAGDDWGPALQAAIDSGARVIYLPRDTAFQFMTPVSLRGKVERLVGFGGALNWAPSTWKRQGELEQTDAASAPPPLLVFEQPDAARVTVLDRLECVHVRHASPATLVLRSSSTKRYTTGAAGGKLFIEDVGGADWHFDHPQRVWARQWNPESHAAGPCIHSRGATIWALGFKTEYESQKLLAEAGAQTEILGGFIYPIGKIPPQRPIFENRDSRIALIYGTSVYQSNHKVHVRDIKGKEEKLIGNELLKYAGSRGRMDLYVSDGQ